MPTPRIPTRRPASEAVPQRTSAAARIPWNSPYAVSRLESPQPPRSGERPVTQRQVSSITSMSATDVPASQAVT